jgi:hypothetical protein
VEVEYRQYELSDLMTADHSDVFRASEKIAFQQKTLTRQATSFTAAIPLQNDIWIDEMNFERLD